MSLYQINDWGEHFENNKSKERDACRFFCVPNKQHGLGFCLITSEPDGAAIYGIWIMIVAACSRHKKPRNGWLTQDGHQTGIPWAPEDLALQFRRPVSEINRTLEVLSSHKILWLRKFQSDKLEVPADCPPSVAVVPDQCLSGASVEKRREEKSIEEKGTKSKSAETDEEWLASIKASEAYSEIDVEREFSKMKHWCKERKNLPTRRRFINWLNRIDKPIKSNGTHIENNGRNGRPTSGDLRNAQIIGADDTLAAIQRDMQNPEPAPWDSP